MNVKTAIAVEIAGVRAQQFNEAISQGFYLFAPETGQGVTRQFDTADMIGLCAFGILLRADFSVRVSAEIANEVMENVRSYGDDLEIVVIAWTADGTRHIGPWFGEGNEKGRTVFDPNAPGFAFKQHLNITEIGKHIFSEYRRIFQIEGVRKNASEAAKV